jgi:Lon protease-like protein
MKQEPIATVANRACALLPLHRQLRAQRLPAVAVATPAAAVVVAVVEAVVVAEEGAVAINNFQKKH